MNATEIEVLQERFAGLQKLVDERYATQKEALKLQAAEYERRLDALNGEAGRIARSQAAHVSRELFDQKLGEVERRLSETEKARAGTDGRSLGIALSVGAIVTIINIVINIIKVTH